MKLPPARVAAALLLAACSSPRFEAPPPVRPDVLLVVLDTTRADFFSGYGFGQATTPRLDRLAATGVRFDQAFSTSFWTLPGHATLLTGLYPRQVGATSETHHLPESAVTVAEVLAGAGYRTLGVSCNSWVSRERGFAQGFDSFEEPWRLRPDAEPEPAAVRLAAEWIRQAAPEAAPYFLFVNLNGPHMPYDPPRGVARGFVSQHWPEARLGVLSRLAGPWAHFTGRLALTADDFEMLRQLYAAEIRTADLQVERLLVELERAGTLDETVVVVTSDHGEHIGEQDRIGHALSMYDAALRVPLIVRYPARFATGEVVRGLVSLVDVAPTVLDLAGAVNADERPLVERRSLAGERRGVRRFVVAENERPAGGVALLRERFPEFDAASIDHPLRALRTDRYKLIQRVGVGTELYDLIADPEERNDLAASLPRVRDDLLRGLETWESEVRAGARPELFQSRDEQALEWLRSLGYIQ